MDPVRPFARQSSLRDLRAPSTGSTPATDAPGFRRPGRPIPGRLTIILRNLRHGKIQVRIQHEHLESLIRTLDRSSNRISFALIIAALLVASSMLVPLKSAGFSPSVWSAMASPRDRVSG